MFQWRATMRAARLEESTPDGQVWIRVMVWVLGISAFYATFAQLAYGGNGDAPFHLLSVRAWTSGAGFNGRDLAQVKYPPGWSLLLIALQRVFGSAYGTLARVNAALIGLVLVAAFAFARQHVPRRSAIAITLAIAVAVPSFILATRNLRSEVVYTAASLGMLAWCQRARSKPMSVAGIAGGAALLTLTVMFRTIGVGMLVAIGVGGVLIFLRDRREGSTFLRRCALPVAIACLALVAWRITSQRDGPPDDDNTLYTKDFWSIDAHRPTLGTATPIDFVRRLPGGVVRVSANVTTLLGNLGDVRASWTSPLIVGTIVIVLAGLLANLVSPFPLVACYVLATLAIVVVWPYDEGTRFIYPLLAPLLVLLRGGLLRLREVFSRASSLVLRGTQGVALMELLAIAMQARRPDSPSLGPLLNAMIWVLILVASEVAVRRAPALVGEEGFARASRAAATLYLAIYAILGVTRIAAAARENWQGHAPATTSFAQASAWIASHTPVSAVLMAQRPLDFVLGTGRRTVSFPNSSDCARLSHVINAHKVAYLVSYDESIEDAYYFPTEHDRVLRLQAATHALQLRQRFGRIAIHEVALPVTCPGIAVASRSSTASPVAPRP